MNSWFRNRKRRRLQRKLDEAKRQLQRAEATLLVIGRIPEADLRESLLVQERAGRDTWRAVADDLQAQLAPKSREGAVPDAPPQR